MLVFSFEQTGDATEDIRRDAEEMASEAVLGDEGVEKVGKICEAAGFLAVQRQNGF